MNVIQHTQATQIYEAQADGVYSFVVPACGIATFYLDTGSGAVEQVGLGGNDRQHDFSLFMSVGDRLLHSGAACELKGFRIGSEF